MFICYIKLKWFLVYNNINQENKKRRKVTINKINQEILENNAYLEEEANKLDAEIEKEVEKWNNMFPEFPMQYAYTYATYYFYQALKTYRADNIKEVINSFEEYLYCLLYTSDAADDAPRV